MANPSLRLLLQDPTVWPNPVAGRAYVGLDELGNIAIRLPDGTVQTVQSGSPCSLNKQASATNTPVAIIPTSASHKEVLTITGAARTLPLLLSETDLANGSSCVLLLNLPATAGIILEAYSDVTLLWSFTNDTGAAMKAAVEFYKDGATWKVLRETIPAFT